MRTPRVAFSAVSSVSTNKKKEKQQWRELVIMKVLVFVVRLSHSGSGSYLELWRLCGRRYVHGEAVRR